VELCGDFTVDTGCKPDYDGLKIDPCIPKAWDGYKVTRYFRGSTYEITVKNPNHVSKGVAKITVDGNEISGNILPVFNDGKTHKVEVIMDNKARYDKKKLSGFFG